MDSDLTSVDLTNCDREPIHIPGSIQPHGAMLVCDPATNVITYASETAEDFLGRRNSSLVGLSLTAVIGEKATHDLRNAIAKAGGSHLSGILLGLAVPNIDTPVDAVMHQHEGRVFVEFEPTSVGGSSAKDALDMTQSLVRRIGLETSVDQVASTGAKLIRAMLGYDRVMVYQFLHNGAGRVIAEAKTPRLGSFMGQHFPASDIPLQARRLYLLNPIRMIGDVNYAPIPLKPSSKTGEPSVDMSFAQLRSVSPIHCEYLRNMGVAASMSISVVVDGQLWGLISCHHDTPKVVPMPLRVGADLFGQYLSLQIALAERRANHIAANDTRERLDQIVSDIVPGEPVDEALFRHVGDLANLIESTGAGAWVNGSWRSVGRTPPRENVDRLIAALQSAAGGSVWSTNEISTISKVSDNYGTDVAGLLAIPISSVPRDYLILFRTEEAFEVEWAGKPEKQVVTGPSGERLSPRGSFDTWREDVRGRSKPWTQSEMNVGEAIRTYLRDVVLRYNEATADERDRTEQRRRVLNDELNHRVKNIISLVKSIALQTGAHASSVEDYSRSMEGRLRALAFAHDQSLQGGSGGDIETLVEAEASLHRHAGPVDRVHAEGPAVGLSERGFGVMALVVHELMTNAAKYGSLSVPEGRLEMRWAITDAGDCAFFWRELDGPIVLPPTRSGFGSKLVQRTIGYDLGGTAELVYDTGGVRVQILIPARHLVKSVGTVRQTQSRSSISAALKGLDVLVVEDQSLIAMDTEEALRNLGAVSVRLCASVQDAKPELERAIPDCAVLDFNLGDDNSAEIADILRLSNTPFIFATGYGDTAAIPDRFKDVPIVRKPVSATALADKMELARTRRQRVERG